MIQKLVNRLRPESSLLLSKKRDGDKQYVKFIFS